MKLPGVYAFCLGGALILLAPLIARLVRRVIAGWGTRLRAVHEKDLGFIEELVVEGAQHGHFAPVLGDPTVAALHVRGLAPCLLSPGFAAERVKRDGGDVWLDVAYNGMVIESYGARAGFALLKGVAGRDRDGNWNALIAGVPADPRATEIYMLSIHSSQRGRGLGTWFMRLMCRDAGNLGVPMVMRCRPASVGMKAIGERLGFRRGALYDGAEVLVRMPPRWRLEQTRCWFSGAECAVPADAGAPGTDPRRGDVRVS